MTREYVTLDPQIVRAMDIFLKTEYAKKLHLHSREDLLKHAFNEFLAGKFTLTDKWA